MKNLTQQQWQEQLANDENAAILDVRTLEEFEEGYIPNAINIDIYTAQAFLDKVKQLDKTKNYYVYCKSGGRSSQACSVMQQLGFTTTYNLLDGFKDWKGEVSQ